MDNFNFYKVVQKLKKKYSKEFINDLENFHLNKLDIENNFKTVNVNWNKSNGFKIPNPFYVVKINIEGLDYEIPWKKATRK